MRKTPSFFGCTQDVVAVWKDRPKTPTVFAIAGRCNQQPIWQSASSCRAEWRRKIHKEKGLPPRRAHWFVMTDLMVCQSRQEYWLIIRLLPKKLYKSRCTKHKKVNDFTDHRAQFQTEQELFNKWLYNRKTRFQNNKNSKLSGIFYSGSPYNFYRRFFVKSPCKRFLFGTKIPNFIQIVN